MISEKLLDMLRKTDLKDVFDTTKVFWKEALNFEATSMEEWVPGHDPEEKCNKWAENYALLCPECDGQTEVENVCKNSPFYEKGYRSMIMCNSEECTYYEYVIETMVELSDKLKEVVSHG
jgi:hypothetical protein